MIESFGVPQDQIAKYAGLAVSTFPLAQTVSAVPWGRASDDYGRRPIILLGLTSTMITSVLWGFSRSIWWAITVRALAGAGNGNVGIIRTAVAEMVPWKELQPRGECLHSLKPACFLAFKVVPGPIILFLWKNRPFTESE